MPNKKYELQKAWEKIRRKIGELTDGELAKILITGRFPNNNTYLPLYKLQPRYDHSKDKIEFLCPTTGNTPRKYVIPDKRDYLRLVKNLIRCWSNNPDGKIFGDYLTIKELIQSNKKIIPVSCAIFNADNSNEKLDKIIYKSIIFWKEFFQYHLYEDSIDFNYVLSLDIKDFYSQIYVHIIPWVLTGDKAKCKIFCRDKRMYKRLYCAGLESAIMDLQDRQTNGIPIGSLGSDLVAEMIMCKIVDCVEKQTHNKDYIGARFKDDIKILCRTKEDADGLLDKFGEVLNEYNLYLNDRKTNITDNCDNIAVQPWYKKLIELSFPSIGLKKGMKEYKLKLLDQEFFGILSIIDDNFKESDGNFWYEFKKRYLKYLKFIYNNAPASRRRLIVWFLKKIKEYPSHIGSILDVLMSIIPQSDFRNTQFIFIRIVKTAHKRNYDFCYIWLIYFIAERYLKCKDSKKIYKRLKKLTGVIRNEDIKRESIKLVNYILLNQKKLRGLNPISQTFQSKYYLNPGS